MEKEQNKRRWRRIAAISTPPAVLLTWSGIASAQTDAGATASTGGSLVGAAGSIAGPALLIVAVVALAILGPRIVGPIDRLTVRWPIAWLKGIVIVVAIVVMTILIPDWVINQQAVAELDGALPDLIATGVWSVAFGAVLLVLWGAGRKHRI